MRLLVSVRSAAEVAAALAGGADIVDAKEPSRGGLGPVSEGVLRVIAERVPADRPLSVALGDVAAPTDLAAAMALLAALEPRPGDTYIKIGLSGAGSAAGANVDAAVLAAAASPRRPAVIVVAYADHGPARAPAPEIVVRLARDAGAAGVLLDTWGKAAGDLLHHMPLPVLGPWVEQARAAGLLVALAGSLSADGVRAVSGLPADIVGVRGAACLGGREGLVAEDRVAELRVALARSVSGCAPQSPGRPETHPSNAS